MKIKRSRLSSAIQQEVKRKRKFLRLPLLAGLLSVASGNALALSFDLGEGTSLDWDTSLSYSAAWREASRDDELVANPNADDGNRSFNDGSMITNRLNLNTEADINFGDFGFFVRGRAYYDEVYHNATDHDSPSTFNAESVAFDRFTSDTEKLHGEKAEILDAFIYGDIPAGQRNLNVRLGKQVVSWGESLFLQTGISSTQSPLDATAANVPGVELKEIFLPVGQLYAQLDINDTVSVEGFVQYDWDRTRLNGAGSYYSTSDILDEGGENVLVPAAIGTGATIDRAADNTPDDSGQWGIALRYLAEDLNDTEFGLYYVNYHDKTPMVKTNFMSGGTLDIDPALAAAMPALAAADTSSYFLDYAEDIDMLGFSVGTVVGDTNVSGELAYRQGQPVQVVTSDPTKLLGFDYALANTMNAQVSVSHVFGPNILADNLTLLGEVGYNRVNGLDSSELINDKSAWGYQAKVILDYNQLAPGLDLKVPVSWKQGVNGDSSLAGSFVEGSDSITIGADFTYQQSTGFGISYTSYPGDADENSLADRDFIAINAKYSF